MATPDPNAPAAPTPAEDPNPLLLAIETVEMTNCGDHAERVRQSHILLPGETVEDLVRRVLPGLRSPYGRLDLSDEVVIRVMANAQGQASGVKVVGPGTDPWSL